MKSVSWSKLKPLSTWAKPRTRRPTNSGRLASSRRSRTYEPTTSASMRVSRALESPGQSIAAKCALRRIGRGSTSVGNVSWLHATRAGATACEEASTSSGESAGTMNRKIAHSLAKLAVSQQQTGKIAPRHWQTESSTSQSEPRMLPCSVIEASRVSYKGRGTSKRLTLVVLDRGWIEEL